VSRLLVLGRDGQVARALARAPSPFQVVNAGRARLDLGAPEPNIGALIDAERPVAVVNAAAYTAVDAAESNAEAAWRLNCQAPEAIGRACAERGLPLVHFSTDYVFDGEKGAPYVESDPTGPVNAYARSKADGETALLALAAASGLKLSIVRVAWVFSAGGGGFFDVMVRAAAERDEVSVVADQWGSPTDAGTCASAAIALASALVEREGRAEGLFHACGATGLARADFAEAIFRRLPRRPRLRRIASADYPTAARRPRDTRLDCARLDGAGLGWRAPALEQMLDLCFERDRAPAQ